MKVAVLALLAVLVSVQLTGCLRVTCDGEEIDVHAGERCGDGGPSGPGELYACGASPLLTEDIPDADRFCGPLQDPIEAARQWSEANLGGAPALCVGTGDPKAGGSGILVPCWRG